MARLMFLIAWLRGPRSFSRLTFFYLLGMLFLFYCLVGGLSHIPSSPAQPVKSPYAAMPKPNPVPPNAAAELRKRINGSQRTSY